VGGKSKADNSAVVQQQNQQAAEAKQKEADRQARLQQGLASIKNAFEGTDVTKPTTSNYDWSTLAAPVGPMAQATGVPEGYTAVKIPSKAAGSATPATTFAGVRESNPAPAVTTNVSNPNSGGFGQQTRIDAPTSATDGAGGGSVWGLQDASGKIYNPGDPLSLTTQTPTGEHTGGFDDAFYNKYKQAVLDYYTPQVDKQYKDAKNELTYRLARSGNIRSSAANTETANLSQQNDLNLAGVRNQADTAAGDLRSQVATERAKATSQLYATEDPEVAANQALSAVSNISLQQPDLSPLTSLFNVATVGGANLLKGYQNQQYANTFNTALAKSRNQNVVS